MDIPKEFLTEAEMLPLPLRKLLEDEIAAGNEIVEIGHSFPAPPVGAYFKLARRVSTRSHDSDSNLNFYDRNTTYYSGEFTDAKRFFFILEPPHKQPPSPNMDTIRKARAPVVQRAKPLKRHMHSEKDADVTNSPLDRFRKSMTIDYEKWHDGIGYDLDALNEATPEERDAITNMLISRDLDWRDVEALASLDTPRAREVLLAAASGGSSAVKMAVLSYAPELVDEDERTRLIVSALRSAVIYGGLSQALDEVESHHPPEVVDELLRGLLEREGDVAVHFAAMLFFIHGKADAPFDMEQRPFFLRFNTDVVADRRRVFRELCKVIGVNPMKYL
jgi:hypothetical protein